MERIEDSWGNRWHAGSVSAVAHLDDTIEAYLGMRVETGDHLKRVFAADPDMPMAHILKGYFGKFFSTPKMDAMAAKALGSAEARLVQIEGTAQEQHHLNALRLWVAGDMRGAIVQWEAILRAAPHDVMAIKLVQFSQFYLGDGPEMRASLDRVLPAWSPDVRGYGFIRGSYGFAAEESGDYRTGESAAREAVAINPADVWSAHACAHVMEMEGRAKEGAEFLGDIRKHWDGIHNFRHHAEWHLALLYLELGEIEKVLDHYDEAVWTEIAGDYLDISNGVALLWRLQEIGVDVGDRWQALADLSALRSEEHCLLFADLHFLLALLEGGKFDQALQMRNSMHQFATAPVTADRTQAQMLKTVGLAIADAMIALKSGNASSAQQTLGAIRHDIFQIGGSHAQRDLFDRMLVRAAMDAGDYDATRSLLNSRISARPRMGWNHLRLAELEDRLGHPEAAADARARADQLLSEQS